MILLRSSRLDTGTFQSPLETPTVPLLPRNTQAIPVT
jgi:hypothetical protein